MTILTELSPSWSNEKSGLSESISSLKRTLSDFKITRKSEWNSFKQRYYEEMEKMEHSYNTLEEKRIH